MSAIDTQINLSVLNIELGDNTDFVDYYQYIPKAFLSTPVTVSYVTQSEYEQLTGEIWIDKIVNQGQPDEYTQTFDDFSIKASAWLDVVTNHAIQGLGGVTRLVSTLPNPDGTFTYVFEGDANGISRLNYFSINQIKRATAQYIRSVRNNLTPDWETRRQSDWFGGPNNNQQSALQYEYALQTIDTISKSYINSSRVYDIYRQEYNYKSALVSENLSILTSGIYGELAGDNIWTGNNTFEKNINIPDATNPNQAVTFRQLGIEIIDRVTADNNLQDQITYIENNYVTSQDFLDSQQAQDLIIAQKQDRVDNDLAQPNKSVVININNNTAAIFNILNYLQNLPKLADMELRNAAGGTLNTTYATLMTNATVSIPSTNPLVLDFDTTTKEFTITEEGNFIVNFTTNVNFTGTARTLYLRIVDANGTQISNEYQYPLEIQSAEQSGFVGLRVTASMLPLRVRIQGRDSSGTTNFFNVVYEASLRVQTGGGAGNTTDDIFNVSNAPGATQTNVNNIFNNKVSKLDENGNIKNNIDIYDNSQPSWNKLTIGQLGNSSYITTQSPTGTFPESIILANGLIQFQKNGATEFAFADTYFDIVNKTIRNVNNPVNGTDAANKNYVDSRLGRTFVDTTTLPGQSVTITLPDWTGNYDDILAIVAKIQPEDLGGETSDAIAISIDPIYANNKSYAVSNQQGLGYANIQWSQNSTNKTITISYTYFAYRYAQFRNFELQVTGLTPITNIEVKYRKG